MISSQEAIDAVASRIERAYRRRFPAWLPLGLSAGVWTAAAFRLLEAAKDDPSIPVDPELYVAVQKKARLRQDPWVELTHPRSSTRYLRAIRRIARGLRAELRSELHRCERRLLQGESVDQLIASEEAKVSPLACFILAHRASRPDLSARFRAAAQGQDRACPLYRLACRPMLPAQLYPASTGDHARLPEACHGFTFSLN